MPSLSPSIRVGLMFGKFFASTFTGSMFGAGPDVFALWGYVVASAVAGVVEINPAHVGAILGCDVERVKAALDVLCSPDGNSRSPVEDGRRLVFEGGFSYRVVNHAQYRAIRNEDDRRAYNREAKQRERANKVKRPVIDNRRKSTLSAHTEAEAEAETESETKKERVRSHTYSPEFERAWIVYPRKVGKPKASSTWKKMHPPIDAVLSALKWQVAQSQWVKDGGEFIPHMATWLNQRRWEDEPFHVPAESAAAPTEDWFKECGRSHNHECDSRYTHWLRVSREVR